MGLKNNLLAAGVAAAITLGSSSALKAQDENHKFKSQTTASTQAIEIGATLNETNAISGQYKNFMNYYGSERKVKKMIETGVLKIDAKGIEIAGIKFPSNFTTLTDLKEVPGLTLGENVFENGGFYYFTLDGVQQVENAGYPVITRTDWDKVIDAVGGDLSLLAALFNFPSAGGMSVTNAQRDPYPLKDGDFFAAWGAEGKTSGMMLLQKPSVDGTPLKTEYLDGLQDINIDRFVMQNGKYKTPCTDVLLLLLHRK